MILTSSLTLVNGYVEHGHKLDKQWKAGILLRQKKLHKAISELPEKQKKRLILHYFQELTYVEIAEREKCSTRAVEYSIHGAIQSLKRFFEKN